MELRKPPTRGAQGDATSTPALTIAPPAQEGWLPSLTQVSWWDSYFARLMLGMLAVALPLLAVAIMLPARPGAGYEA